MRCLQTFLWGALALSATVSARAIALDKPNTASNQSAHADPHKIVPWNGTALSPNEVPGHLDVKCCNALIGQLTEHLAFLQSIKALPTPARERKCARLALKIEKLRATQCASYLLVHKRDEEASIQDALENINDHTLDLIDKASDYEGGWWGGLQLKNVEGDVQDAINSAVKTARSSGPLSAADSTTAIAYVTDTLEPSIAEALKILVNKQSVVEDADMMHAVGKIVAKLGGSIEKLFEALVKDVDASEGTAVQVQADKLKEDFAEAQQVYPS